MQAPESAVAPSPPIVLPPPKPPSLDISKAVPFQVPREQVAEAWPHMLPHIRQALVQSAGEYWPEDVLENLEVGAWQGWISAHPDVGLMACAVTSVEDYPRARILFLHLAGGHQAEAVSSLWPLVNLWAASQGCSAMRFMGRKGWARSGALPEGFRLVQDSVVIPVTLPVEA